MSPQLKLAAPFAAATEEGDNGTYASVSLTPQTELSQQSRYPVTLTFPLEIDVGLDDYYGAGTDTAGYARTGVSASTPLDFMPSGYGSWRVTGAIDVLARDADLRAAEPDFADETWVPGASVSLAVTY